MNLGQTKPEREHLFRAIVTISVAIAGTLALYRNIPISSLPDNSESIVGGFRIIFGLLLIFRLWRSQEALPMIWGWQNTERLQQLWKVWYVLAFLLLVGFLTPAVTLASFILGLYIFRKSFYYSIEDIYFQLIGLNLIFLNSGLSFSLDRVLGIHEIVSSTIPLIAVNFLFWSVCLTVMSAGFEKFMNPTWRKGLGFYYFIGLPHFVRKPFKFLRQQKRLCLFFGYFTVFGQLSLLPSLFILYFRDFIILEQLIFGILLFTLVDLSFIPQIYALQFSALLIFDLMPAESASYQTPPIFWLGLLSTIWIASVSQSFGSSILSNSATSKLARFTTGATQFKVFTEAHLFGLYLYRLVSKIDDREIYLLDAFNDDGSCGAYQHLHPRYFQGAMYPITDTCIARLHHRDKEGLKLPRLLDLCYAGMTSNLGRAENCRSVEIQVKAVNPDNDYCAQTDRWLDREWTTIGECKLVEETPRYEWTNEPPLLKIITRQV